jgi:cytochrome o ubiquinol oxidase subunit IV
MNRVVSYTVGLFLAILLTLAAFSLAAHASHGTLTSAIVIPAILMLAMVQLAAQLIFFLHLGRGKDSQWNFGLFCFTFFGILVVVLASVWIMYHLNYNMTPMQINQYINDQSSF